MPSIGHDQYARQGMEQSNCFIALNYLYLMIWYILVMAGDVLAIAVEPLFPC